MCRDGRHEGQRAVDLLLAQLQHSRIQPRGSLGSPIGALEIAGPVRETGTRLVDKAPANSSGAALESATAPSRRRRRNRRAPVPSPPAPLKGRGRAAITYWR